MSFGFRVRDDPDQLVKVFITDGKKPDFIVSVWVLDEAGVDYTRSDDLSVDAEASELHLTNQPCVTTNIFNEYLNWLYCKKIPSMPSTRKRAEINPEDFYYDPEYEMLARLMKLAEHLEDSKCQEAVRDAFIAKVNCLKKNEYARLPGNNAISIFSSTTASGTKPSLGWDLMLAIYIDIATADEIDRIKQPEFKQDLMDVLLEKRRSGKKARPMMGDLCQLHNHDKYEYMCQSRKRKRVD